MKKQTEYQRAKSFLKEMADIIKEEHPQDKPMQRMVKTTQKLVFGNYIKTQTI